MEEWLSTPIVYSRTIVTNATCHTPITDRNKPLQNSPDAARAAGTWYSAVQLQYCTAESRLSCKNLIRIQHAPLESRLASPRRRIRNRHL